MSEASKRFQSQRSFLRRAEPHKPRAVGPFSFRALVSVMLQCLSGPPSQPRSHPFGAGADTAARRLPIGSVSRVRVRLSTFHRRMSAWE